MRNVIETTVAAAADCIVVGFAQGCQIGRNVFHWKTFERSGIHLAILPSSPSEFLPGILTESS